MATAPICSCLEVPNEEGGGHQEAIKGSSGDSDERTKYDVHEEGCIV